MPVAFPADPSGFLVVIVDDRATNRTIYSQLAASAREGVAVRAFGDAEEALLWLRTTPADLVITDFRMPGMEGDGFVARLRQPRYAPDHAAAAQGADAGAPPGARPEAPVDVHVNADVPVVVITAHSDRDLRMRALEAGATDFLHSPVDPYEFRTRVRNLLVLGQQQRRARSRAERLEVELGETIASRQRLLRESREQLAQVIDTVPAIISARDEDGRLVFANAYRAASAGEEGAAGAAQGVSGADPDQADAGAAAAPYGAEREARCRALDQQVFRTGMPVSGYEEEVTDRAGRRRTLLTSKTPLRDGEDRITCVLTTSLDITARKQAERRALHLSQHDGLTGLPSRARFREELARALAQGRRGDTAFALLFVDLDRFKLVNDGMGHHVGDEYLCEAARRLRRAAGMPVPGSVPSSGLGEEGKSGTPMIARLGGDEFAVLLEASPSVEAAATLAKRINQELSAPLVLAGAQVDASASIGIALYPRDGHAADDLLQNADSAMYRAKLAGRRGHCFFGDDALVREGEQRSLHADLRHAIPRGQFVLHYQPQHHLRTGEVVGAEALLRWQRPGWGLLAPAAFLPAVETGSLALPVANWVLRSACAQAAEWHRNGRGIPVSVNLSPAQAKRPGLANAVLDALDQTGLPPGLLVLELTDRLLLSLPAGLAAELEALAHAGVGLCLDNYGVAAVSDAALRAASIDWLKLDSSRVQDGGTDPATLRGLVEYGRALGLRVTACGVETAEHLTLVRDAGCEAAQGYLMGRPYPAAEFVARRDRPSALSASVPGSPSDTLFGQGQGQAAAHHAA